MTQPSQMVSEQLQSLGVSRLDIIREDFNRIHERMISILTEMMEAKSASKNQSNHCPEIAESSEKQMDDSYSKLEEKLVNQKMTAETTVSKEVSPTTIENQGSHVVVLRSDAGMVESGGLDNLSVGINVSGDGSDTCEDHSNSKSTEDLGLGQESQNVINAVKVKSQGFEVSSQDQIEVKLAGEVEETVDETDLKLETKNVSGPILEEIKEDLRVADVHHPEEPDSHTDCNGEPPAVMNSGIEINAALPTESFSTSSSEARESQKEIETCDAKSVEGVSLLPADAPKSESNVEKGPLVEDSMRSFNPSDANSESKSAFEIVDYKERQPTSQGDDVHIQTEVSSGNANCTHSPYITADVKLESKVENSSILSRDVTIDGGVSCGSEVLNGSTVNDEGMLNIFVKTEDVENLRDELADEVTIEGISTSKTKMEFGNPIPTRPTVWLKDEKSGACNANQTHATLHYLHNPMVVKRMRQLLTSYEEDIPTFNLEDKVNLRGRDVMDWAISILFYLVSWACIVG